MKNKVLKYNIPNYCPLFNHIIQLLYSYIQGTSPRSDLEDQIIKFVPRQFNTNNVQFSLIPRCTQSLVYLKDQLTEKKVILIF